MTSISQTQMQRRKSGGRLKLSRELMIRLALALDARKQQQLVATLPDARADSEVGVAQSVDARKRSGAQSWKRRARGGQEPADCCGLKCKSDNTLLRASNLNSADRKSLLQLKPFKWRRNLFQRTTTGLPLNNRFALTQLLKWKRRNTDRVVIWNRKQRQLGQNGNSTQSCLFGRRLNAPNALPSNRFMLAKKKWLDEEGEESALIGSQSMRKRAIQSEADESSTLLKRIRLYRNNSSVIESIESVERVLVSHNSSKWAHVLSFAREEEEEANSLVSERDKEEKNLDPLQLNLNPVRSESGIGNEKEQSSKLKKRSKSSGYSNSARDCESWRFKSALRGSEKCDTNSNFRIHQPTFFPLLLLLLLLALGPPLLWPVGRVSGQSTSDELSRAVLATMSTQSPTDSANGTREEVGVAPKADAFERVMEFWRIFVMGAIIVGDICGNSLVILSVCRHSKLRVTTNWFVVSLACADILVALFAMTFNASVIISGRWLFKPWVCDFWNSCDVLASTASILHLCCISIDRYIAITRPLDYPMKITTRRVVYALCAVWISSALLSYIPIFTGVYTTQEHIQWLNDNPDQCEFVVNRVYAIVSSSISFWIPSSIMVFTYYRIYKEATRQEKFIYKTQSMMPAPMTNHHHSEQHLNRSKQRRSKSMALVSSGTGAAHSTNEARIKQLARQQQEMSAVSSLAAAKRQHQLNTFTVATTNLTNAIPALTLSQSADQEPSIAAPDCPQVGVSSALLGVAMEKEEKAVEVEEEEENSNSGQSTPTKRSQTVAKMKREHKAAKTLGIIMGVFILCWLPFFSWYTPQHICGHACDGIVPRGAVTILFWIGYFNSTLNPIIYAYFNHEFRDAFKKTLQWIFCCCNDLKCLRVNRPNDNQHYNCTYRSTQEIGLVSNS